MPRDPFAGEPIEMERPAPEVAPYLEIPSPHTWGDIAESRQTEDWQQHLFVNLALMIRAGRVRVPVYPNGSFSQEP